MKPTLDYPIESLSDATWQHIEDELFAKLARQAGTPTRPKPALAWRVGLVSAGLLLAAAALLFVRTDDRAAFHTEYLSAVDGARALQVRDVHLQLEPGAELVAVHGAGRQLVLVLERGAARFAVPPRSQRDALVISAGDTRVEVIGTEFRVARTGASAEVETYSGTVRVTRAEHSALVTRGQHWPAAAPPVTSHAQPITASEPKSAAAVDGASERPVNDPDRQRKRFEQAAAREQTDAKQARQIYQALARESGPWAGNALYALARLELELKDYDSAARHLSRYLERFPHGANALDARALLQRIASQDP